MFGNKPRTNKGSKENCVGVNSGIRALE